jgi:phosphatidylinositol alpha-mannosyltransferase
LDGSAPDGLELDRRVRIGLVCPYDLGRPGGVQQQVLDLGRLLVAQGEAVTVIGPGAETVAGGSYQVFDVGRVRPIRANGSVVPLALGFDIARRIRTAALDLDVLHVHEPFLPMVGPAALRAGRPVVATFHARPPAWISLAYRVGPLRWLNWRWLRGAVLTAVSAEAARAPGSFGSVVIIPNGLDVASYGGSTAKIAGRVVFLGRNEPRKGLEVLTDAWPWVTAIHGDASLVVIGAERSRSGKKRKAAVKTTSDIEFRGRVSEEEKRRLLREASVMVAPNLGGESFGLVLVEALASGCAVVASDIAAFRAVAGGAAVLVKPRSPADLADAISRLLSDPSEIEALSRAGRQRAGDFDWSRVLPQYLDSYERAVRAFSRLG